MNVFVVIIKDHHTDIAVEVWTDREAAIDRAHELANVAAIFPEDYKEWPEEKCEFCAVYSVEGDSVRVMKKTLQQLVKVNK